MPNKRIKLLIVCEVLTGGGAERVVSTLLTHLDRSRFEPHLCLLRDEISYPVPPDVPVTALGHGGKSTIRRSGGRLRSLIEAESPDVVMSAITYVGHFVAAALRSLKNKPIWVARIGDNLKMRHQGWRRTVFDLLLKRDFRLADRFIVNSEGLASTLAEFYPDSKGRIVVLRTPCDFAKIEELAAEVPVWQAVPETPLIISVGRLHPAKRPDLLVDAFARLPHGRSRLVICGDGPLRAETEARIRRHGLSDHVQVLGFCDNPFALLRQADVFVLTSDTEGLPNALIEAQGLGVPAVATRCPFGPDEIVEDGKTGILTPVGDAAAIADALLLLLGDMELRKAMGERAASVARGKFDVSTVLPRWDNFLRETFLQETASTTSVSRQGPVI